MNILFIDGRRCPVSTIILPSTNALFKAFLVVRYRKSRRKPNFRLSDSHKNAKAQPLILVDTVLANSVKTFIRCPRLAAAAMNILITRGKRRGLGVLFRSLLSRISVANCTLSAGFDSLLPKGFFGARVLLPSATDPTLGFH